MQYFSVTTSTGDKLKITPPQYIYSYVLEKKFLEKIFEEILVHRMKNLMRRDGRIQGIHEKVSSQQKVSVGENGNTGNSEETRNFL